MKEVDLIEDMLRQTFDGRPWHGPSFMALLKDVDKVQASERPIDVRHTIWEIVNHCSYWMEVTIAVLLNEKIPDIKSNEDWPKMGKTDEDWIKAQDRLKNAYETLVDSIEGLNETLLAKKIHGSYNGQSYTTTYRKVLHGISDYNTYHAGQIAILRRKTA
ncbi:MAG: DinB family protein [Candidatus Bathyarchaeota archaeon]|nr:MAG: DinB family protein [Candidatus Bathyarchaeota archaeon]